MQPPHETFGSSTVQRFGAPVELAHECLASHTAIAPITIYYLPEEEMHTGDEQQRLLTALLHEYADAERQLEGIFGAPQRAEWNNRTLEWDKRAQLIPISGIACASFWTAGTVELYLAASKEDRETPFYLVIGVINTKPIDA